MVELQPIFKRAYWSLAAGGLLYVLFVFAMTFPEVQRLYVLSDLEIVEHAGTDSVQCSLRPQGQPQSVGRCQSSRAIWVLEYDARDSNGVSELTSSETQVQPFHLVTPDNETLYGWHLLPLHLCHQHEKELMYHPPNGPANDYTETMAYKILAEDPNARVVVSCKCLTLQNTRVTTSRNG